MWVVCRFVGFWRFCVVSGILVLKTSALGKLHSKKILDNPLKIKKSSNYKKSLKKILKFIKKNPLENPSELKKILENTLNYEKIVYN